MKRQSRHLRHRQVSVTLTERDALVLEALVRFRLARTRDLIAAAFPRVHPTTAKLRLRRLFDGGFLDVRAGERSEENIYTLGTAGKQWARDQGLALRGVPRGGHDHHLAIVRAWAGLAEIIGPSALRIRTALPDWELREMVAARDVEVVPDLFVVLEPHSGDAGAGAAALAVEVDLGTEALPVLRRKILAYDALAGRRGGLFGWHQFGLAMALRNPGRVAAVSRMLEESFGGWWLLWTEADGPATAVAGLVETLAAQFAPTATESRYGDRRDEGASPLPSRRIRAGGTGP